MYLLQGLDVMQLWLLYSLCKAAIFTLGPLMLELRVQRTGSQPGKMDVKQGAQGQAGAHIGTPKD